MTKNIEMRLSRLEAKINSDDRPFPVHLIKSLPYSCYGRNFDSVEELSTYERSAYPNFDGTTLYMCMWRGAERTGRRE